MLRPIPSNNSGGRLCNQELTAATIGLTGFVFGDRFVGSDETLLVGLDMIMLEMIVVDILFEAGKGRLRLNAVLCRVQRRF